MSDRDDIDTAWAAHSNRTEVDRLKAEIERLEIALVRYGHHDNGCPVLSSTTVTACECGYRAALAREEPKEKKG